jgi:hypothetical protein
MKRSPMVPSPRTVAACILNSIVLLAAAAPITASFPTWVFGNHTDGSACSHFVPIDIESANAPAYNRALQCNSSRYVVIVPGDTPIHTKQPLQIVSFAPRLFRANLRCSRRLSLYSCRISSFPFASFFTAAQVEEEKLRLKAAVRACKDYNCCVIAVSGGNGDACRVSRPA